MEILMKNRYRFAEVLGARLVLSSGKEVGAAPTHEDVFIRIRFSVLRDPIRVRCGFDLYHKSTLIFRSMDPVTHLIDTLGMYEGWGRIPRHLLSEVMYSVNAFLIMERADKESSLIIYNALSFMAYAGQEVEEPHRLLKGALLAPRLEWTLVKEADLVST